MDEPEWRIPPRRSTTAFPNEPDRTYNQRNVPSSYDARRDPDWKPPEKVKVPRVKPGPVRRGRYQKGQLSIYEYWKHKLSPESFAFLAFLDPHEGRTVRYLSEQTGATIQMVRYRCNQLVLKKAARMVRDGGVLFFYRVDP